MNPEERQNSVLAVGILIAVLLLLYAGVIMPALTRRTEYRNEIGELQFQQTRFEKVASQRNSITKQLKQLRRQQIDTSGFLKEKSESLAAADLQNHIKNIIDSKGGNLISTQVIQHKSNVSFPYATIRIQMSASIVVLQEIIYNLESGSPTLFLDNVYLQRRNPGISRRFTTQSHVAQQAELIEARFDVTGYIFQAKADTKS